VTYRDVAYVLESSGLPLTRELVDVMRFSKSTTTAQVLRQMVKEGVVKKVKVTVTAYKWSAK
jgi:hypothetical protein